MHNPKLSAALLFLLMFVTINRLEAHGSGFKLNLPDFDLGVGPSVAYVAGPEDGYSLNLDISCTYLIFTASSNLKMLQAGDMRVYGPQLEITAWIFVNLGGGAGYLWGTEEGAVFHLFFGVPFGHPKVFKGKSFFSFGYIEPYYRLNFFKGDLLHEAGIMLKVNTWR